MTEASFQSPSSSFASMRLDPDDVELIKLHRQVLRHTGRVVLTTRDSQSTVLISKSELDALEQALAILSDTDDVREMRDQLARIAALASGAMAGA